MTHHLHYPDHAAAVAACNRLYFDSVLKHREVCVTICKEGTGVEVYVKLRVTATRHVQP